MKRREFSRGMVALTSAAALSGRARAEETAGGSITDVQGIKVGHFTETRRPTGCTVLIFEKGATAGVDVRGSAPGTRETDLLNPTNTVQQVQAILLAGGSAYGLDAATGVVRYLEEHGLGFHLGSVTVPIVPAAILYDLGVGDPKIRPNAESGYKACQAATTGKVAEGNVGAGAGATVGKMFGAPSAMKSGIGTASIRVGKTGIVVAAIVAVNAVGDVVDPKTGKIVAGARKAEGSGFRDSMAQIRDGYQVELLAGTNTTIGVVATNVALDKTQMTKIAQMAHDGLARTINPAHTLSDGDTIFAVATGAINVRANHGAIGALAADVMAAAVLRAVRSARGLPGLPSASEFAGG
ncbi:MAG TPA: P1 family peptidase [Bryobacteraceae bacterium]|nr:P1 family peptidase [Bryobacteraceae bacterium]